MFCYRCGAQLPEGARFCPGCGAVQGAVQADGMPSGQNTPYQPQRRGGTKSKGKLALGLGIAGVLIVGIVAAVALGTGQEPGSIPTTDNSMEPGEVLAPADGALPEETAPDNKFLSPLSYWGMTEADLDVNSQEDTYCVQQITVQELYDRTILEDYAQQLVNGYAFELVDTAFEEENGSYLWKYYFDYTGTAQVGSTPQACSLFLSASSHSTQAFTEIEWRWGTGLEPAETEERASTMPALLAGQESQTEETADDTGSLPDLEQEEMPVPTSENSQTAAAPLPDGPVVPDFAAFTNQCALLKDTREFGNSTEYFYFWDYEEEALEEYISLLVNTYGFTVEDEYHYPDLSDYYAFDYAEASLSAVSPDWFKMEDGHVLYIRNLHAPNESEFTIRISEDIHYVDTGDRTTCELEPQKSGGGSASSGSSGSCLTCSGSGTCAACGGTGKVREWLPGTREYVEVECTQCYRSGQCRDCNGTGDA